MFKWIVFALAACFIWGLIFVVPQFMIEYSSIEIALGRYLVYGLISLLIFLYSISKGICHYPRSIWVKAFHFSLVSTIVYYTFVVLALRYSSPPICALILGISPITIAFYGNWQQKEIMYKSLIIPSFFILIGLVVINIPHLETHAYSLEYALGLVSGCFALIAWSWYVVANARFLKKHPIVRSSDWSTLIGVATLFWVLIFAIGLGLIFRKEVHVEKYFVLSDALLRFLLGSAILGLLCSWVGAFLWNKASTHLPVSLAGQLTVFETVFGVIFVYTMNQSFPSLLESLGIITLLVSIIYAIRKFSNRKAYTNQIKPH